MGKEELRQRRPAVNMNFPFQISFDHLLVTLRSNEGCYLLALSASLETEKPNRFQALGDNMSRRHGIWLFCALRASRERLVHNHFSPLAHRSEDESRRKQTQHYQLAPLGALT